MTIYKLGLLLELLDVNISWPNDSGEYSDESTECGHEGAELILVWQCQKGKENVHHCWDDDHHHGYVDVGMIKSSYESKYKDQTGWL